MRIAGVFVVLSTMVLMSASCADVLGIKEAELEDLGAAKCGLSFGNTCGQKCIDAHCCSEMAACGKNAECKKIFDCSLRCAVAEDPTGCTTDCFTAHPDGLSAMLTLASCMDENECSSCTENSSGGSTGSGGVSATGGKSSTGGAGRGGSSSGGKSGTGGASRGGSGGVGGTTNTGGGSGSGGAVGGAAAQLDAAIQRFSTASCNKYSSCSPGYLAFLYGTVQECVARTTLQNRWLSGLPNVSWTATAYTTCASSTDASTCDQWLAADVPNCSPKGRGEIGAPCRSGAQCASTLCEATGNSCGQCVTAPGEGDPCVSGGCGDSLICADGDICRRARGEGENCTGNLPCAGTMHCYQGKCTKPLATSGAACDTDNQLYCDASLSFACSATTKTCLPVVKYANASESCGVNSTTSTATLCSRGSCTGSPPTCVGDAADRAVCDPDAGKYCEWPASCFDGTCQLLSDLPVCTEVGG